MEKVIIVTHEFTPFRGGAATYAEELAAALHRLGRPVEVWTADYGADSTKDDFAFPVRRLSAGGSLRVPHMFQFTRELWERREQLEHATVLLASVGAHMAFMILVSFTQIRSQCIVPLLHGSEALRFRRNPIWRLLARRFYRQVDRVATVSRFSKSLLEQSRLLPSSRPIILAPGACSSAAARLVSDEAKRDGPIRILTLARVHPRKGQLETARALALLPPELRCKIIYSVAGTGDSSYLERVEKTCRDAGVAFEYLGLIEADSIATVYAHCDIYAMTSRTLRRSVEGFGITYLEAGFHGKPVVAYRTGGASEAVIDGETGLLVEEGNLQGLSDVFSRLIREPALRERLGSAGRRHAAQFSWDATARALLGEGTPSLRA